MPMLLKILDKIAIEKQRDVLFLDFPDMSDWRTNPIRRELLEWFKENQIAVKLCFPPLDVGTISYPYTGSFYMDVPYDIHLPEYKKCVEKFENSDEMMKIKGVDWYIMTLEEAEELTEERSKYIED